MDSERTLRRPPLFHFFSPRPVVVKLRMRSPLFFFLAGCNRSLGYRQSRLKRRKDMRMRSPLPGTPTVSLGCHHCHQLQIFCFYSHSASSFPSPSFPWSPRHEYTLNDTRFFLILLLGSEAGQVVLQSAIY